MSDSFEQDVMAEIEALRDHVRRRDVERERRDHENRLVDLPTVDVTNLELPQVRALVADRFENARLRNRLAEAERRIAELEQAIGRT